MKKVTTTRWVKQEEHKFIADDFKVFDTEAECRAYEMKGKLDYAENRFKQIAKEINIPFFTWGAQEEKMYVVTMENESDFGILQDYAYAYCNDCSGLTVPDEYPVQKIIVVGYDYVTIPVSPHDFFPDDPAILVKQLQKCIDDITEKTFIVKSWDELANENDYKIFFEEFILPTNDISEAYVKSMNEYAGMKVTYDPVEKSITLPSGEKIKNYIWERWMLK